MQKTSLVCNNFSGINRSSSVFSSSIITASDIQNVELFATETNSGVGIRTSSGNIAICDLIPDDEIVVNIFESIQKSKTNFFVHTESSNEGKIYYFNGKDLELNRDNKVVVETEKGVQLGTVSYKLENKKINISIFSMFFLISSSHKQAIIKIFILIFSSRSWFFRFGWFSRISYTITTFTTMGYICSFIWPLFIKSSFLANRICVFFSFT